MDSMSSLTARLTRQGKGWLRLRLEVGVMERLWLRWNAHQCHIF